MKYIVFYSPELRIGFVNDTYSGSEGGFVRPEIAILSGMIAPGLMASVRFHNLPTMATSK